MRHAMQQFFIQGLYGAHVDDGGRKPLLFQKLRRLLRRIDRAADSEERDFSLLLQDFRRKTLQRIERFFQRRANTLAARVAQSYRAF